MKAWPGPLDETVSIPGDKSLTHRGILFSALARGDMIIENWLDAADTRSSLAVARALGVDVRELTAGRLVLAGVGRPAEPDVVLDCGNSGTTMRLACGLVAGVPGLVVLTGDQSLTRRPMARVLDPLRQMGIQTLSRRGGHAPLAIQGGPHGGGTYRLPVASAQVKSALLLAGITAEDSVAVEEPAGSRDHTERLLQAMGGRIMVTGHRVVVEPGPLDALSFAVPGDPSSASFWALLAAISPRRRIRIPSVLFNPTRTGFFRLLEAAGARTEHQQEGENPEPWGALTVSGGPLTAVDIDADQVPAMVDEVPLAALLATQAHGTSVIRGAGELRVKESDRIHVTAQILRAMGASIEEREDGWLIEGPTRLHGANVDAAGDHRMAMLAAVAATIAEGVVRLRGDEAVSISYPGFFVQYERLARIAS